MAKTLPGTFTEQDPGDLIIVGDPVQFDGDGGFQTINRNHNWLMANRSKSHVSMSWVTTAAVAGERTLRETNGAFQTRLEYRITPRRHMPRVLIRINAGCNAGGVAGEIRVSSPAANATFTFTGAFGPTTEQTAVIAVTNTAPPTTQIITVEVRKTSAVWIELRRLMIRDDTLAVGDLP